MKKELISFVIPCYCSQKSIPKVVAEIKQEVAKRTEYDYEIILVNDHSKDDTYQVIKQLAKEDHNIVAVNLARNFGQASAIMTGFHFVTGEYVVSLDDDGQMPIESIYALIDEIKNGHDVVFGRYDSIKQKWYRNFGSWVNVKMTELLLEKPKEVTLSSFWAAKRYVIDEMIKYEGPFPYVGGLLLRVTRDMTSVPVVHRERNYGKSGYSFLKLISLWMNGFTAFSVKPLRMATFCGGLFAVIGFAMAIVMVIRKILNPAIIVGYASTITIMLVIGGMIMLMLGILGEYIGRIYISINAAPQYVINEVCDYRKPTQEDERN